jgi:ubiquinone biosynthesis monooxygenase Coq7
MTTPRRYSPLDQLLISLDQGVRTVFGRPQVTERPNPARDLPDAQLDDRKRDHTARLMRVNHTGEVCAQALYQGQALTANLPEVRDKMDRAAREENDHLDWCEKRINELGGRKSLLNPLFYAGSFAIGALAGAAGDKWSLGFVVETERQVESHLEGHLQQVPDNDQRTRAILEQMKDDEVGHANMAQAAGGAELPAPIKLAMKMTSKLMTRSVYWL